MTPEAVYAHSRDGEPESTWEPLHRHLEEVGALAGSFAGAFGSYEWGYLAGLWHDLGKYRPEFQDLLRGRTERAPHAAAGAAHAQASRAPALAFPIAGHHTGLANRVEQQGTKQLPLKQRLIEGSEVMGALRRHAPAELLDRPIPALPLLLSGDRGAGEPNRVAFWVRFIFSALVDADRLATEAFYEPGRREAAHDFDSIPVLRERLDRRLSAFVPSKPIDILRARVLADCRAAASELPGLFSLTVPTGGGKTLSSMAFALEHAERHSLRRVIVVIPYTSIIEQSASVYRDTLGERNVIEHHSALDEAAREEESTELEVRRRLASENWDAPVIVTTSVQFFESLFSNEPSRCRKLHNIARSVVVIDEAQTLPTDFLLCLLDAMRELVRGYGCSLVLSTATQPALSQRSALPQGLRDVREIVRDPDSLTDSLRRVEVRWPTATNAVTPYTEVAAEMAGHEQVLAIVHQRRDARVLAELLPPAGRYHLSTRMCAAHRAATLRRIRKALDDGDTCRVVSTQLVEAGVDIDFPVVYRAMAGLDSLAQAAGRCNRNGLCTDAEGNPIKGQFIIFRAETSPPPGILGKGLATADAMLMARGDSLDFTDHDTLEEYFRSLYMLMDPDRKRVIPHRDNFDFATVAQLVRFIDDGASHPIVVPWGEQGEVAARVRAFEGFPSRAAARALQPFVVQLREYELWLLQRLGAVAELAGFGHLLAAPYLHLYDDAFGLTLDESASADAAALIT